MECGKTFLSFYWNNWIVFSWWRYLCNFHMSLLIKFVFYIISKKLKLTKNSILGFHVTSEKTKIKNWKSLPSSGKSHFQTYICWPVFSSVDRFVLKVEQIFFSQCVTSSLFLGNMLRARKYRFALCFRVLSNQYVERSAYANVFKFNRENKRFGRAKVNCFPAATLESLRLAPTWRLNTKHYIFQWHPSLNHSSSEYRSTPKLWHVVYLLL